MVEIFSTWLQTFCRWVKVSCICIPAREHFNIMELSITQAVRAHLKQKDISISKLARLCDTTPANMHKKLHGPDMETKWVARISTALHHNFFEDLSRSWRSGESVTVTGEEAVPYGKNPLEEYIITVVKDYLKK